MYQNKKGKIAVSKSKKRLIIICSILGVFIVLGIIFGALFCVRRISVDFATAINRFENTTEFKNGVIEASGVTKGKNIIFTNFNKVENKLEKAFPYGRFQIVRNFPNKIIIYIYEREPVFKIKDSTGDWHIYDEDLKLLQIVSNSNLEDEFNELPVPPSISGVNLNLCSKEGEVMNEPAFKAKYSSILDGVYGAKGSPIHIMSDITFSFDALLEKEIVTFTIAGSGTKIVVQGSGYFTEKIANGVYLYLSTIREDNFYTSILDQVVITVYDDFVPKENPRIVVSPTP